MGCSRGYVILPHFTLQYNRRAYELVVVPVVAHTGCVHRVVAIVSDMGAHLCGSSCPGETMGTQVNG